jgi:hypothetical protein
MRIVWYSSVFLAVGHLQGFNSSPKFIFTFTLILAEALGKNLLFEMILGHVNGFDISRLILSDLS